jgi:hypothetical protein
MGPARAVGGDGAAVAFGVGELHVAQADRSAARAGAANRAEAQQLQGARDQFAVEAGADENGDPKIAKAVRAGDHAAVPEGEDAGAGDEMAGRDAGVGAIFIAQGEAKQPDQQRGQRRNNGDGEPLRKSQLRRGGSGFCGSGPGTEIV